MYILLQSINRKAIVVPQKKRVKKKGRYTEKVNPLLLAHYSLSRDYSKSLVETYVSPDKKSTFSMLRMVKDIPFVSKRLINNKFVDYTKVRLSAPTVEYKSEIKLSLNSSTREILSAACFLRGKVKPGTYYLNVKLSICNDEGHPFQVLAGTLVPWNQKINIHKVTIEKVYSVECFDIETHKPYVKYIYFFSRSTMRMFEALDVQKYININTQINDHEIFND